MSLLNYTTSFTATPNPIPFYQPPPSVTFNPPLQGYQPSYPPYQPNEDPQNIAQNPPNHPNNPYYNSYPQQINHQAPRQTAQFTSRQSHQTAPQNIPNNTPQNYAPNTPQNIPQATLQNSAQYKPQNGVHQGPQVSPIPDKPPGFTRVEGGQLGGPGTKTQIHAVVDYDDDFGDYDYENDKKTPVTPIQGPIFIKNGSVPVVPLYSYPVLNNGTFVQIPILWTALSVALGLEIRGEIIRGVPCIKRYHQLFCPTAGNSYPLDRIEEFIDENKALMKRMYGDFQMTPEYGPGPGGGDNRNSGRKAKRNVKAKPGVPDLHADPGVEPEHINLGGDSFFAKVRRPRQSFRNNQSSERVDACESKTEIVTPYWASNSAGKIRAIVNTQHFEQAIHQEVCKMVRTNRCSGDCGCEQKYKWHRLLAYDPDNDCKGIFMDWFLFPSCCVCRCNPT